MKMYIETRDGWWRNSPKVIVLGALVMSFLLTLGFVCLGYAGVLLLSGSGVNIDLCLYTIMTFIVTFPLGMIWSYRLFKNELTVIYTGEEDHFKLVVSSIESSLNDLNIKFTHILESPKGKSQHFKLDDLKCNLNISDKSNEIKPHGIMINMIPVNRRNQRSVLTIISEIRGILKHYDMTIYRDYKDLISYYDSF
jgi:hypothetical protein